MALAPDQADQTTPPEVAAHEGDAEPQSLPSEADEAILKVARTRLQTAEKAERGIRENAEDDLLFVSGEQWPLQIKNDREKEQRPCLVINRLPQFVQQITNDQRQNRQSLKVHPIDSLADIETAKIIQGIHRHIENNSNAETAYDTAFESAVRGGFGYWRITTEFSKPDSFDQEIKIKRIKNPMSVYFDPFVQEADGSDARWGFVTEDMAHDVYKAQYPGSSLASADVGEWTSIGNDEPNWLSNETVRVAEYFYIEEKDEQIHLLSDGRVVRTKDLQNALAVAAQANMPCQVAKTRIAKIPVVKWIKMNAIEILDRTDWLGQYIPIIPVYGNEIIVKGERKLESLVRHAKDPQRALNFWKSAEAETIALAPRAPFIGAEGQFEGHEDEWEEANKKNHPYLEYKPKSLDGTPLPPPQRQTFEPAIQAISQASAMAADDLKSTTGVYDAALGAQTNEESGIAIQRRTTQTQTSNFHFVDNLRRALRHSGRVVVDLIPRVYDTARAARIIGEDDAQKIVMLNRKYTDPETGKEVLYDLDVGLYDVTVDTGPSFASKRQEAAASMLDLSKSDPDIMKIAGDLIVKNMDWSGAQEISERIKRSIPPNLIGDDKQEPIPQAAQAQINQMQQLLQMQHQEIGRMSQIIATKQIETQTKKMELEHDERIELAKIQADLEIAAAKLKAQGAIELLGHQVAELMQREKLLFSAQPIGADNPDLNPESAGAQGAQAGRAPQPTGGSTPGQSVEGTP